MLVQWGTVQSRVMKSCSYVLSSLACKYSRFWYWRAHSKWWVKSREARNWRWRCFGSAEADSEVGTWSESHISRYRLKVARIKSLQFCIQVAALLLSCAPYSSCSTLSSVGFLPCQLRASAFLVWKLSCMNASMSLLIRKVRDGLDWLLLREEQALCEFLRGTSSQSALWPCKVLLLLWHRKGTSQAVC